VGLRASLDDVEKREFLTLPGFELLTPSVAQSVASRYTDCAIRSPRIKYNIKYQHMFYRDKEINGILK
jgi:hypothetical protein